jgi:hypothetical protein
METTIKINSLADLNLKLFSQLVKDIISACGSVEITIKPKFQYNREIIHRVQEINNGGILYSVEDFEDFVKQVNDGKIIDKNDLIKIKADEKGNFISC